MLRVLRPIGLLCCLCVPLFFLRNVAHSQRQAGDYVFAPIPAERRARLAERLNLLIDYQVKQNWAKQYDLFSALRRRAEGKMDFINLSRKEFANGWKSPLISFTPKWTREFQQDKKTKEWFIAGCATVKDKDAVAFENAGVEASWERNDWFFSEVQMFGRTDERQCGQPD